MTKTDFYEDDEPPKKIEAMFLSGDVGITAQRGITTTGDISGLTITHKEDNHD